jgi:hypothetical protein
MKLVGGDGGRVEDHELVDQMLLGPSERAVVDMLVEHPGALVLEHRSPRRTAALATITVTPNGATHSAAAAEFQVLRTAPELAAERQELDRWRAVPPDKVLALVAQRTSTADRVRRPGPADGPLSDRPERSSHADRHRALSGDDRPGRCRTLRGPAAAA